MTRGFRFLKCPDCGKKGVRWVPVSNGEDNFQCRYCPWYAFTLSNAEVDVKNLERLHQANPEKEDW